MYVRKKYGGEVKAKIRHCLSIVLEPKFRISKIFLYMVTFDTGPVLLASPLRICGSDGFSILVVIAPWRIATIQHRKQAYNDITRLDSNHHVSPSLNTIESLFDLVKYCFWSGEATPGVRRPVIICVRKAYSLAAT